MDALQSTYVKNLADAIDLKNDADAIKLEEIANQSSVGSILWNNCLRRYIECEHIEMTEKIIEKKMDFNTLMKINYKLGDEIIVKSGRGLCWGYFILGEIQRSCRFTEYDPPTKEQCQ